MAGVLVKVYWVRPTTVWQSPWCKLVQFDRDMSDMRRAGHRELDPARASGALLARHRVRETE